MILFRFEKKTSLPTYIWFQRLFRYFIVIVLVLNKQLQFSRVCSLEKRTLSNEISTLNER
jgi:hypothetical protein